MISAVLITSLDGRILAKKKYAEDVSELSIQSFTERIRTYKTGSLPPVWDIEGLHAYHIKRQGLYLAALAASALTPVYAIGLLSRLYHLLKDFCGTLNEESIRVNDILIYEILDEFMDYGHVEITATEKVKPYIQSEPVPVRAELTPEAHIPNLFGIDQRTLPSNAADKPVIQSRWEKEVRKNEIFLDVIERMTVLISANDNVARSEVSGSLNMKSFLFGSPEIKLGLNEDLVVGKEAQHRGYGCNSRIDECQFHQCVNFDEFRNNRILNIRPPDGEFALMSYGLQGTLPHCLPFRLYAHTDESKRDIGLELRLRCDIPKNTHAVNIKVNLPLPKSVTSVSHQLSGPEQAVEFTAHEHKLLWRIKKLYGKSEVIASFKLLSAGDEQANCKEIGPAALDFEISGFVCSNLQIRFLRVFDTENSYVPQRWVRYITITDSYIIKL